MSQEQSRVVRYPISAGATSRRSLEERFAIRFPNAVALLTRGMLRLPPHSELRRRLVRRTFSLSLAAYNRKDLEATYALYHPSKSVEIIPHQLEALGFESVTRGGREAIIGFQSRWHDDWGGFRIDPQEALDLGDGRMMALGRIRGSGVESGAGFANEWALVTTLAGGWIIREQFWFDHAEALEAVGLQE